MVCGLISHCGSRGSSVVVVGGLHSSSSVRGAPLELQWSAPLELWWGGLISGNDVQRHSLIVVMCWRLLSSCSSSLAVA